MGYVILSLLLITSVTVGSLYAYLYYDEKKDLEKAIQNAEQATEDYEELLSELESDGYIPKDEVDNMINQNTVSIKDKIRSYLENGDGVLMMLENLYDDMIVVPNSGRYNFFNIDSTLKASEIDKSKLCYPVKNEETGQWEKKLAYRRSVNTCIGSFGHGVTSLYLASRLFSLSNDEALAIRWHMGEYNVCDAEMNELHLSNETFPIVQMIQFADRLSITKYLK